MGRTSSDRSPRSTVRLVCAVLGYLLLTVLLVSGKVVEIAERLPLGDSRDQWVGAAERTDRVSNFLALNRPYDFVINVRGAGTDPGERVDSIEEVAAAMGLARDRSISAAAPSRPETPDPTETSEPPETPDPTETSEPPATPDPTATSEPPATPDPTSDPGPTAAGPESGQGIESPEATVSLQSAQTDNAAKDLPLDQQEAEDPPPPPTPTIRAITADDPLRVYVAGDSQAFYPGYALARKAGRLFDVTVDSRHSTGLARPDYFNWPAELHKAAADDGLELVVLFLGANDWQTMQSPEGALLSRGSDDWRSEWAWRVEIALEALSAPHRHIVWVGQPPARPESFQSGFSQMNEISRQVTLNRPDVTFLDIWELFGGDGPYREFLDPPSGGSSARVRQDDGIHLNRTGSAWVAERLFEIAIQRWHLPYE